MAIAGMCTVLFISFIVYVCVPAESQENVKGKEGDIAFPDDLEIGRFSRQNYVHQHHFHHHPDFFHHHHHHHQQESEDSASAEEEPDARNVNYNESIQIPLDYIQNLNDYNISDLLINFVEGAEEEDGNVQLHNRFGDDDDSTGQAKSASVEMAKEAGCMPELQTVKLASTDDPSILYIPQCTRIERCGGCCKHNLLSCRPSEKQTVAIKVYKTKYTGAKKLKFLGAEAFMIERHSSCKCDCRVQPEDCTQFQSYSKSACQCVCKNHDEMKKCNKNNGTKLWNSQLCTCECRESITCSTGSYFDRNVCKCVPVPMKYRKRSYRFEPPPVVPLNEDY